MTDPELLAAIRRVVREEIDMATLSRGPTEAPRRRYVRRSPTAAHTSLEAAAISAIGHTVEVPAGFVLDELLRVNPGALPGGDVTPQRMGNLLALAARVPGSRLRYRHTEAGGRWSVAREAAAAGESRRLPADE